MYCSEVKSTRSKNQARQIVNASVKILSQSKAFFLLDMYNTILKCITEYNE